MKRQAAELGRLRTGYSVPNKDPKKRNRAVRSETFIFSSHSRDYVAAAAQLYGGQVEEWTPQGQKATQYRVITEARELRAVLPTGDPLSQSYEMWTGGGCARRCDGQTEQLTRRPCLCLAQYGEKWHERGPDEVCRPTTRINVMLPDLPDVGVWRLETHSYYAADVMAGVIDTVLQATDGKSFMPVRMWIEQRTRKAGGVTKNFPVVMVVPSVPQLRQALSGPISTAVALGAAPEDRPALEPGTGGQPDYLAEARACRTAAEVRQVWVRGNRAGHIAKDSDLSAQIQRIAADIDRGVDPSTGEMDDGAPGPDDEGVYDVEVVREEADEPAEWPEVAQPGGGAR
ncbi:hypothetical protein D7M15_08895 [Streptomyces sp. Z26]|nr:hypothetical protein D7M15_08895 [Streptomyces sp. Z26]